MKISTKGRYALRVMIDLATNNNGEYITLKDISQRQNISIKYLEQIVSGLKSAGYLQSMRGGNGGHRLAKDPSEYNVGEILRVMEGTLNPVSCSAGEDGLNCPLSASCHTIDFWKGLDDAINKYVDSFTLADLLEQK